mgnify:FL=1
MKFLNKKSNILIANNILSNQDYSFNPDYYVYTDGACKHNGKNYSRAGIGIYFGLNNDRNVSIKLEGSHTNNTAELLAIIHTYPLIENDIIQEKKIVIVSDSIYALRCVSTFGEKCYKKNWNVSIPNKNLVQEIYELYKDKSNIKFMHIYAHTNKQDEHSYGNQQADNLANKKLF